MLTATSESTYIPMDISTQLPGPTVTARPARGPKSLYPLLSIPCDPAHRYYTPALRGAVAHGLALQGFTGLREWILRWNHLD